MKVKQTMTHELVNNLSGDMMQQESANQCA